VERSLRECGVLSILSHKVLFDQPVLPVKRDREFSEKISADGAADGTPFIHKFFNERVLAQKLRDGSEV